MPSRVFGILHLVYIFNLKSLHLQSALKSQIVVFKEGEFWIPTTNQPIRDLNSLTFLHQPLFEAIWSYYMYLDKKKQNYPKLWEFVAIDLFTDTAAILNLLGFLSIMGCPEGMSTILYICSVYIRALFGPIFL